MTGAGDPVTAYFDARAAGYRAALSCGLWAIQRRREAARVLEAAQPLAGRSLLDLGCGTGFYGALARAAGAGPVVMVDRSPAMIAEAGAVCDGGRPDQAVVGDAAAIDLGRRFDRILLAGVLEFVPDASAVLDNARRHLAPGGRIVLLAPSDGAGGRLYRAFHRRHGLAITLFSPSALDRLAAAAGLRGTSPVRVPPFGLVLAMEAS